MMTITANCFAADNTDGSMDVMKELKNIITQHENKIEEVDNLLNTVLARQPCKIIHTNILHNMYCHYIIE